VWTKKEGGLLASPCEIHLEGVNRRNLKIINFEHKLYPGLGLKMSNNEECGGEFFL
jgi:hypothetical protein